MPHRNKIGVPIQKNQQEMRNNMKKIIELVRSNVIVQAVVSLALGVFLLVWPQITVITLVYFLAVSIALSGIASLISYYRLRKKGARNDGVMVTGLFLLIIALVVFIFPESVASFFSVVLGILLILSGVVSVLRSVEMRGYGGGSWIAALVVSLLIAVGGIVIVVNPFDTTVAFVITLGILLVVKGITDLLIEIMLSRKSEAA